MVLSIYKEKVDSIIKNYICENEDIELKKNVNLCIRWW